MKKFLSVWLILCLCFSVFLPVSAKESDEKYIVTAITSGAMDGLIRFVVPMTQFNAKITENSLAGYQIKADLVHKSDSKKVYHLDSTIMKNEVRTDGNTVLCISPTAETPLRPQGEDTYNSYSMELTITPPGEVALPDPPEGYTGAPTIFIKAQDFKASYGSWNIVLPEAGSALDVLKSGAANLQSAKPAQLTIQVPKNGKYTVWARARDYESFVGTDGSTVESGTRFFHVAVGGTRFDTVIGDHGEGRFCWEYVGEIDLNEGKTTIEVIDTSAFYARMEALLLTTEQNLALPETAEQLKAAAENHPAWILPNSPLDFATEKKEENTKSEAKAVQFKEDCTYYVYTPNTFKSSLGSWKIETGDTKGAVGKSILMGKTDNSNNESTPATAKFGIPKDGFYKVMVHTRDFSSMPGTRLLKVQAGDNDAVTFGALGKDGWGWEETEALPFTAGEKELKIIDYKGYNARVDMVVITNDLHFRIDDSAENFDLLSKREYDAKNFSVYEQEIGGERPADDIAVQLNGEYMHFDVAPILHNDRTLVPFRAIFEALGCMVSWDEKNQTAIGVRNGKTISLPIGDYMARINGEGVFMDQPAIVVNDRTLVPLRFVSEALGANVDWIDETQTVKILARIPANSYLFMPSSFENLGTWTVETNTSGAFYGKSLKGLQPNVGNPTPKDANPQAARPASASFMVPKEGTYKLWVRSRDFEYNQQGSRSFAVAINGKELPQKFGVHGKTGFLWQSAGTVELALGNNVLEVIDTSAFGARCDAILLTSDLQYTPAEDVGSVLSLTAPYNPGSNLDNGFPQYAKVQNTPISQTTLENEDVRVVFYTVPTPNGNVVQNEIYAKANDEWVLTKTRGEELGYLVISADNAQEKAPYQDMYTFSTQYKEDNISRTYAGNDLYESGIKTWFVPVAVEKLTESSVKLSFDAQQEASLEVVWSLDDKTKTPLVSMKMTANKDGYFTMGGWEGSEMAYDAFSYALAPYRVYDKRIHAEKCLLTEQFLFTPMGTYIKDLDGTKVAKGVAIEPSFIPLRWVYSDNGLFGINMKGAYNNYRAAAFAPVLGSETSKMSTGNSYSFQYRVISMVGDWFDAYKYVAKDLFEVDDYRQNVSSTLNTAIFNARKLMMDDVHGGWDEEYMAHYNLEGMNVTSVGNSMYAMQNYLLTEDEEVLTKRAIPTIASTLTRKELHFNASNRYGGLTYWSFSELPQPIGAPISGFNSNVYGGMYEMTHGRVPYLYHYALEKGKTEVDNSYGSVASFSNLLSMYKYTGEQHYLDDAIRDADAYLEKTVYGTKSGMISWPLFINISYYPNLASLIDIYEVTGEQRFLDAAQYVANMLATCVWVPGIDGEKKNQTVLANDMENILKTMGSADDDGNPAYWAGDKKYRAGREGTSFSDLTTNANITALTGQVPAWIPSRVGLGIEQSSTFQPNSAHIIMNTWAGDLMRLAAYTGESYFETLARNAIIGRFSNYPGYYQTGFYTFQQTEQYPIEGPDYTNIYAHHIPPFIAMLEDFLINQTFAWSNGSIHFPSLRQQGYAYFNSNQYGHKPGKFYDETEMWPWLDEGIVDTGDLQIDFMAARKDGVVGIAFMNESKKDVKTTVALGEKIGAYTGSATLYNASGKIGSVEFTDGRAELNVPATELVAVMIHTDHVKAPAYSSMECSVTNPDLQETVSTHVNGKGYVLQMSPDAYYAYVYITDKPEAVQSANLTYTVNGETKTITDAVYPYEFIVKVDDATQSFDYSIEAKLVSGATESRGKGKLKALSK